jgi:protein TonB
VLAEVVFRKKGQAIRLLSPVLMAIFVSLLLHLISFAYLFFTKSLEKSHVKEKISLKIFEVPKKAAQKKQEENLFDKKLVETKMLPTEKPKVPSALGYQDHVAIKETKAKNISVKKGLDPQKNQNSSQVRNKTDVIAQGRSEKALSQRKVLPLQTKGRLKTQVPIEEYSKLLNLSDNILNVPGEEGYQDYLEEDLEHGDVVDLNTSEYRYMSYFTKMRKAIELVWNYPSLAIRRGVHGAVGIQFTIEASGLVSMVSVTSSSGYQILDDSIVEAINQAAPFSPLPEGLGRKNLTIRGRFNYVLN